MTTMTTSTYAIHAVSPDDLDDVRASGVDVSGTAIVQMTASGGEPLRCCLRDARPGEDLILFGYAPPLPASPYREIGAVFAHAYPCEGPSRDSYPPDWRGRPQVVRAYDSRGWIHAATMHDGSDPEAVFARLLSDSAVVQLHSRNVTYGCYMFAVTRVH
jgi:hypothetical protein